MARVHIDDLPEELRLQIFSYLDGPAPSELKLRQEPSLDLTKAPSQPLKNASCVSKRWRRIVLSTLFKYACLRLDIPWPESWSRCRACADISNLYGDEAEPALIADAQYDYHMDMAQQAKRNISRRVDMVKLKTPKHALIVQQMRSMHFIWAWRLYHVLQDFCAFSEASSLGPSIHSFTVLTDRDLLPCDHQRRTAEWTSLDFRMTAVGNFWRHLLSTAQPQRIVILAPPAELIFLTNATRRPNSPAAFDEMDFHLLELRSDPTMPTTLNEPVMHLAGSYDAFQSSSVLHRRRWTHVSLNEGSFLRGYSTSQFFDHGPPERVVSLKKSLGDWLASSSIRSATYTAIFPFSRHLAQFIHWLPQVEEFDVQLAPDIKSDILDNRDRITGVQLEDCWNEVFETYSGIATLISTHTMSRQAFRRLKRVTVRDFEIPALREDLDGIFTGCCLPVWVEWTPGVYTREGTSPHPDYREDW